MQTVKILSSYLLKEFLKITLICEVVFVAIYLVVDFVQKMDNFMQVGASRTVMFSYFLYKTPFIAAQLLPSAVLIGAIILLSIMRRNREITALKACGVNLYSLFSYFALAALVFSAVLFLFSEVMVRNTTAKYNDIWMYEVEKRDPKERYYYGPDQIWYRAPGRIYWIQAFDKETGVMRQPRFFFFDRSFAIEERMGGDKARWEDGQWVVSNGYLQQRGPDGDFRLEWFEEKALDIPETPETFVRPEREPEEMGFLELRKYAAKVEDEGYDNTRYLVDMHIKVAYPFIVMVMILVGMPIPLLRFKMRTPLAVSIGMAICFLYLLVLSLSRSLGLAGMLPPVLAAWLSNMVFILFGLYLMVLVDR